MNPAAAVATEAPVRFDWQTPLPAWLWGLLLLAAVALAAWSYRHRLGPRWARSLLAGLRALTLMALIAVLAGPQRVEMRERIEPDRLYVLLDTSASMRTPDGPPAADGASSGRLTRAEHARQLLAAALPTLTGPPFVDDRRLRLLTFSEHATPLPIEALADPPPAEGPATRIDRALQRVLDDGQDAPIAGVVLLSDGASPQGVDAALLRRLEQRGVGVFALALGAADPPADVGIARVEAPAQAFLTDRVPVTVWLTPSPATASDEALPPMTLRLVDDATGRVLDQRRVGTAQREQLDGPQRLEGRGDAAGPATWRVELEVDSPSDAPAAWEPGNKRAEVVIELIDRPLRVLYVDGQPRWAYRYLKNLLVRTAGMEAAVLLASAESGFVQEGARALARFPANARELAGFDVLVLGDVAATYFTPEQMRLIRDQIATSGLGLLVLAGPRFMPGSYADTALEDLLPMRRPRETADLTGAGQAASLRPTPAADRLGLLRLDPDAPGYEAAAAAGALPLENLPPLHYVQDIGPLKPAVDVLAQAVGQRTGPLLTQMRYGSGLVMYLATDDLWRWRYGTGGLYDERLYTQLLQVLAHHGKRHGSQAPAVLDVPHRRLGVGQTMPLRLRVRDPLLAQTLGPRISAHVVDAADGEAPTAAREQLTLDLMPVPERSEAGDAGPETQWRTLWRPGRAGEMLLRVVEPALAGLPLSQRVDVIAAGDEWRDPRADHDLLRRLAQATGGAVIEADGEADGDDALPRLLAQVPRRAQRHPADVRRPLWDRPAALTLLLTLLTLEWAGRKLLRLA